MTFDTAQQRQPFRPHLFRSFFQGGFECSTHRERDGRRLDVTRSTAHDLKALEDYRMLAELGIRTIRDGLRWHLIDGGRAHPFDWTSFKPMLEAAEEAGVEVLWDLLHFGWPDHIDVFSADFPKRFAEFSAAAVELTRKQAEAVVEFLKSQKALKVGWFSTRKTTPLGLGPGPSPVVPATPLPPNSVQVLFFTPQ